ncbi:MAG: NAD(P)-binding domain-containing protein, partial [Pseudomonadales bacterium]|nr:NAD(P)-binding domain-containing protein [Pseudomonadales bacterium]
MKTIEIIGVLGAGQMGGGIAHVAAAAGYRVLLADTDKQRAEAGKGRIDTFMQRSVDKGKMEAADKQAALDRITCVDGIEDLGESDFAIEAATESIELKKRLFRSLDRALKKDA